MVHKNHLENLSHEIARPHPQVSDSVGVRCGALTVCISGKFPGTADAGDLRTILGQPLPHNDAIICFSSCVVCVFVSLNFPLWPPINQSCISHPLHQLLVLC